MESSNDKSKEKNQSNHILANLKSDYFWQKLYDNITKKQKLKIVKYNKSIQNILNLDIKYYKEYCEAFTPVEIEIIPTKYKYGRFINIINENDELYYHIYFNDNKEEMKNKYTINKKDKLTTINIIIDYQVKSFEHLFSDCYSIESINFKKFYRNNINNMSFMFYGCSSLKKLNLSNFNTINVTTMYCMFEGCTSLKEINLSNFNTDNVKNMYGMFCNCQIIERNKPF